MKFTPFVLSGVVAWAICLSGCASRPKPPVYDPSQTGKVIGVQGGEIIDVRDVTIAPPDLRSVQGGSGRQVGSAVGRGVATGSVQGVIGAIGGIVGGHVGSKLDNVQGEEITVRLEGTERTIVVVQPRGDVPLAIGDKVKVQTTGAATTGPNGGSGINVRVMRDEFLFAQAIAPTAATAPHRTAGLNR